MEFSMLNLKYIVFLSCILSITANAAERYDTPPISSTYGYVPVISDEQMEQCVKLYNESEWLYKELNGTDIDNYSQQSVDSYNRMVNQHSKMTHEFNEKCAGKQSRSACKAAQKINKEHGLSYQDC